MNTIENSIKSIDNLIKSKKLTEDEVKDIREIKKILNHIKAEFCLTGNETNTLISLPAKYNNYMIEMLEKINKDIKKGNLAINNNKTNANEK
jgi:hypothetical protein